MLCNFCEYNWETRVAEPKACPRCKRRFDYPIDSSQSGLSFQDIEDEMQNDADENQNNL